MKHLNKRTLPIITALAIVTAIIILRSTTPEPEPHETTLIQPNQLTTQHYLEDYQYLVNIIESNYPYLQLKDRTHQTNWLNRQTTTTTRLQNCNTNTEFLEIITQEITALQNRHTRLLTPTEVQKYYTTYQEVSFMAEIFTEEVAKANQIWQAYYYDLYESTNKRYPVEILYDRGNYIITNSQGSTTTQYGANLTVTHINGTPVHTAIQTADTYIDHDPTRDQPYIWALTPKSIPDPLITVTYPNGTKFTLTLPTFYGTPRTNYYPTTNLITRTYSNQSTAYIYIKTFDSATTQELAPTIRNFLEETKEYDYLIIDIRGNTGGAFHSWLDTLVTPLITEPTLHEYYLAYRNDPYVTTFHDNWLNDRTPVPKNHFTHLPPEVLTSDYNIYNFSTIYYPTDTINHTAKRILLTDRTVYSAAEGLANYCKQTGYATIIGTTTGGDGFYVWPLYVVLPHSKLVITMTSSMSLDHLGNVNEETRTIPDITRETKITDYNELIEYTLRLIGEGKIP